MERMLPFFSIGKVSNLGNLFPIGQMRMKMNWINQRVHPTSPTFSNNGKALSKEKTNPGQVSSEGTRVFKSMTLIMSKNN